MALTLDGTLGETLPTWTTAGRPGSPTTGLTGYNTTLNIREVWNGSAWTADSLPAAGTSGNVLKSDGTNWTSGAAAGGSIQTQLFTAPGTFTVPATLTQVRVTVIGGGGGGGQTAPGTCFPGGSGGISYAIVPVTVSTPVSVTVGTGGAGSSVNSFTSGSSGNTSSFGALATATGGPASPGGAGAGSTTGTLLRNSNVDGGVYINMYTNTNRQAAGSRSPIAFSTAGTFGAGNYGTGTTTNTQSGGVDGIVLVEYVG